MHFVARMAVVAGGRDDGSAGFGGAVGVVGLEPLGQLRLELVAEGAGDRLAADAQRYRAVQLAPPPEAMQELAEHLARAERPFAIVGRGDWDALAVENFQRFAAAWDLPVGTSFRCRSHFDNTQEQLVADAATGAPQGSFGFAAGP